MQSVNFELSYNVIYTRTHTIQHMRAHCTHGQYVCGNGETQQKRNNNNNCAAWNHDDEIRECVYLPPLLLPSLPLPLPLLLLMLYVSVCLYCILRCFLFSCFYRKVCRHVQKMIERNEGFSFNGTTILRKRMNLNCYNIKYSNHLPWMWSTRSIRTTIWVCTMSSSRIQ